MKYFTYFSIIVIFLLSTMTNVWSGNLSLIEKRLLELDQLNKQAVQKSGEIPKDGTIEIHATALPGGTKTDSFPHVIEKSFDFGNKQILTIEEKSPFTVQISSSQVKKQCYRVAAMLRRAGYPAFTSEVDFKEKGVWHRIFVGSYSSRDEADMMRLILENDEISDGFITNLPYAIQIGKATDHNVDNYIKTLRDQVFSLNYMPYTSYMVSEDKTRMTRLLVGAFKSKEEAHHLVSNLRENGLKVKLTNR